MSKKDSPKVSQEDRNLFRESVAGTKPLDAAERHIYKEPSKITIKNRIVPETEDSKHTPFVESDYVPQVGATEQLEFAVTGVQPKLKKQLRQGRIQIEATIDLHGFTVAQSGLKLERFISSCLTNATRCILLIHGQGSRSAGQYPVLKCHVNDWLRYCPDVIAFVSALPKDGGPGAMYVLLKQVRK